MTWRITYEVDELTPQQAAFYLKISKASVLRALKNADLEADVPRVGHGSLASRKLNIANVCEVARSIHSADIGLKPVVVRRMRMTGPATIQYIENRSSRSE